MTHWLAVLTFFPETFSPFNYQNLLPECDPEGRLILLFQRELRGMDWVERNEFSQVLNIENDYEASLIYESYPTLLAYK